MHATIPRDSWHINADDPRALTRLLDLPEFVVTALEYDDRLDCLVVLCQPVHDAAVCPACGAVSAQPHQYAPRTVRDLPVAGRICYLGFPGRRFRCARCRRPFTEVLEAGAPQARCTRRYAQ